MYMYRGYLYEGGPISYEATPSRCSSPIPSPPHHPNLLAVLEVEAPAPLVELRRDRYLDPVADFRVQLLRQLRRDALRREG